jgi:hypothetical protein
METTDDGVVLFAMREGTASLLFLFFVLKTTVDVRI